MRTNVPKKILKIVDEIDAHGHASLTRLTVLKKWFDQLRRLGGFALWVAFQAKSRKGKTAGVAGDLFRETGVLLAKFDPYTPDVDRAVAEQLHNRLRDFQNEYRNQHRGPVRVIHNWNLMFVEQGLAIWLWHPRSPTNGYKLAADDCQHYDPRYGNDLNGSSRTKLREIVRFMVAIEAWEEKIPVRRPPSATIKTKEDSE
jgi:hypothetical protein